MSSRPVYETKEDRSRERSVADTLERAWKVKLVKLRPLAPVDFAVVRDGRVVGWVEIKCRQHELGRYPTLILSSDKALSGMERAERSGLPWILCAQFTDAIAYTRMKPEYLNAIWIRGRSDRADDYDIEPCVEIPVSGMSMLCSLSFKPTGKRNA